MDTPDTIAVPTELLERVAQYLAQRPYEEVHQLIAELVQAANPVEPKPEPKSKTRKKK